MLASTAVRALAADQTSGAAQDPAQHVHATGAWTSNAAGAKLAVAIDIDKGYHINANPASQDYRVPTTLTVIGADAKVYYPVGERFAPPFAHDAIMVYTGRATIEARLHARLAQLPGKAQLQGQACNDHVCLAPSTVDISQSIPVAR